MTLRPERAALLLIAGATGLRLVLAALTDLGLDEAYALAVSRHWQLSWFDHPPLVFWLAGAMQALFGPEVPPVLLRAPFIALAAATTWLLFRLARAHFGAPAALWTIVLFTAAPFFLLSAGSWVVPDGPLCFFLVLAAFLLTPIVLGEEPRPHWARWLAAGAAIGLALLSKYHAALFALGVILCFAHIPRLRFWFARPQPYAAALLSLLVFMPVLAWNAQNDWVSFAFQLGRGGVLCCTSPEIVARIFLTEAAYLLPATAVLLLGGIGWALLQRGEDRRSTGFFLALGLPIVLVLDAPRFWTWQSYAHWAMPGWMLLLPLAGAMLGRWQHRWRPALPLVGGATALLFVAVVAGVVLLLSHVRIRIPGIDSYRIEAGSWRGVADGLRAAGALAGDPVIVTAHWRDAARVAEALRTALPVLVFDSDPRGFAWTDQRPLLGRDALIVSERTDLEADFADYFERFEPVGAFPIEPGNDSHVISVVRGRNLLKPYPLPYGPR